MMKSPKTDYVALQVISQVVQELRGRAAVGIWRAGDEEARVYLTACRLIVPELRSAFVLAYEDLMPSDPPDECRFALHFCTQPLDSAYMAKAKALRPQMRVVDEPSRAQRLAMVETIFGPNCMSAWGRVDQDPMSPEKQFHAWLFVAPEEQPVRRWVALNPPEAWPRASGMRRLTEFFT